MLQLCFLAFATLSSIMVCDAHVVSRKYCSFFYYFSKGGCVLCKDLCGPGQGLVKNCGYDEYGRKVKPACATCRDGYFTPKKGNYIFPSGPSLPCKPCRRCYPPSRTKRQCSPTRNTKCHRCPHGMYKDKDGRCHKCSYCCDGMLEKGINVVQKCKRQNNLGRCVCRESTNCYRNINNNAGCPAYIKRTSSKVSKAKLYNLI